MGLAEAIGPNWAFTLMNSSLLNDKAVVRYAIPDPEHMWCSKSYEAALGK